MRTPPSGTPRMFIHIPKNGGMTIRKGLYRTQPGHFGIHLGNRGNLISGEYADELDRVMNEMGLKSKGYEHARWRDFRADLRERCRPFAIVRNPWARTASRYTFAVKVGDKSGKGSFRDFLELRHVYAEKPFYWHRAVHGWYQQKDYVVDVGGELRCDILRTESLTKDVQLYLGAKYDGCHNHSNTGRKKAGIKDWRELYGDHEREIVADWYKEDIDYFGFTFDSPARKNLADCLHTHPTD